jgi:hypothetical protein
LSDPDGFQVDLDDLNALAGTNIPFIEQTCTDAGTTLKVNAQNDSTIFDQGSGSALYLGVATTFTQTRADLENLLDSLSSSLDECAAALREIHRRYQGSDQDGSARLERAGRAT